MFFVFVLSLVTLSDPLPTLSINVGSINGKSHVSPLHKNNIPTSIPVLPAYWHINETSNSFGKTGTSTSLPLQMNNHHKSLSGFSTPILTLSSSDLAQKKSSNVIGENENEKSSVGNKIGESTVIEVSSLPPALQSAQGLGQEGSTALPLLLKLDREYTPVQIAEYIFSTGDEKGFVQGVAEMVEDGEIMVSRDDVIVFLEAVQRELANLRRERADDGDKVGTTEKENL